MAGKKIDPKQFAYNKLSREKSRKLTGDAVKPLDLDFEQPDPLDAEAWLLAYLPNAFPLPFGQVHREIIKAVSYAIESGGNVAIAAPRGTGKSTLVNGLVLWALMTGRTAFPVVLPWDDRAKRRALRFWAGELCFNARLNRDYNDITEPFVKSRGIANRLTALHKDDKSTGARLGITEGIIILPDGKGAIGSATINGNPRGLNYATIDGRIIRPSLCIIDDPQDRETAKSKLRIADTIETINADVAGMAGPDARMSMVMSCTVIERGDVADHYLSHPDWKSIRVGQVITWPTGFDEKGSQSRELWDAWNVERQTGEQDQDGGEAALSFYNQHKDRLTQGMEVSWLERYDRKRNQPDAYFAAMYDYYAMGEDAFAAERQNEPIKQGVTIYTLTPEIIASRRTDRPAGSVPEWSKLRIAATDINPSYGLTYSLCSFGADQTAAVLAYGVETMNIPGGATNAEFERRTYEYLIAHGRKLAAIPCKPDYWLIDAGGAAFDIVHRFCVESVALCKIIAIPATGRGAKNYRPYGKSVLGRPREACHCAVDTRNRKWIAFNADYWREQAQKAWTGSPGAPGSCSLPQGVHRDFAEQICREQLQGKAEIAGQMTWVWNTAPGPHDYGDCMTMCFVGAAFHGIGTGGGAIVQKVKKVKRGGMRKVTV